MTIPEGYDRPQAAQLLKQDGLRGSYMEASVHSRYLNPGRYGGKERQEPRGLPLPRHLRPEPPRPASELVQLQLEDFKRRIKGVNMSYAASKNLTVFDVVTIASMIEREASWHSERKLVSSVIYNRLREGMTLGSTRRSASPPATSRSR